MKKLILPGIIVLVIVLLPISETRAGGGIYISKPSISFGMSWGPYDYGEVWIDGYWTYNRYGDRVWVDGYWERRHRPRAVWVDGYWKHRHGRWVWVDGYWEKRYRPYDMKKAKSRHRSKHRKYYPRERGYGYGYWW